MNGFDSLLLLAYAVVPFCLYLVALARKQHLKRINVISIAWQLVGAMLLTTCLFLADDEVLSCSTRLRLPEAFNLFSQIGLRVDRISIPVLFLIPCIQMTCQLFAEGKRYRLHQLLSVAGASLLIVADDVVLLGTGAAATALGLALLEIVPDRCLRSLTISAFGWGAIFAGLAWLVACVAIVRAAPHGLPGESTTLLSEVINLLSRSAAQHPAAGFVWQQYQRLPMLAICAGLGILSGVFPLHLWFVRTIAEGGVVVRLWHLLVSKIALLLVIQTIILPDLEFWSQLNGLLFYPALFAFVFVSVLLVYNTDGNQQIGRLIVWSHQTAFLGLVAAPEQCELVFGMVSVPQTAALCLFILLQENCLQASRRSMVSTIASLTFALPPSAAGMMLTWHGLMQFSQRETLSATSMLLLGMGSLASLYAILRFSKTLIDRAETSASHTQFQSCHKWGVVMWCLIAVLGSLLVPVMSSTLAPSISATEQES